MTEAILRKACERADLNLRFFEENAELLERCVEALAQRFTRGTRFMVMGDGGQMPAVCDFRFTVRSRSIHRIQEMPTALLHVIWVLHVIWDLLQVAIGADDVI